MAGKTAIDQATDHVSDFEQATHAMDVTMLRAVVCDLGTLLLRYQREYGLPIPEPTLRRLVDVLVWTAPESGETDID